MEILLDGNVKASEARRQHLSSHEKTTQEAGGGVRLHPSLQQRGQGIGTSEIIVR